MSKSIYCSSSRDAEGITLTGFTRMIKKTALAGVLALASLGTAHATPQLQIQLKSGATTINSPIGPSPLTFVQSIGNFSTTVNTGTATGVPALDLSSVDIVCSSGGTLTVTLSANGFLTPFGAQNWLSQFSGNFVSGSATVKLQTYLDNTNTLFGTGTALSTLTDTATPFGLHDVKAGTITHDPFALTEVMTITATGAAHVSLDASVVDAPEPASMALLGAGMIGIGATRRRRTSTTTAG